MRSKLLQRIVSLIRGGFLHILVGNILSQGISMITSIIIARFIDKADYASISYADNIYSYIAMLSGLGLSSALLKYCAVQKEKELEKAYVDWTIKVGGVFVTIVSLVACVVIMVTNVPFAKSRSYMWALLIYPFLSHIMTTMMCYMRSKGDSKRYAWTGIISSISLCVLIAALVIPFGINGVIPARYMAIFVPLTYANLYYLKMFCPLKRAELSKPQKKEFLSMGISLMIANLFSGIMPINETFLVNNLIGDEIITSNFRVAGQFPQLLTLFSGAITVYYFPLIAKMDNNCDVRKIVVKIGLLNFGLIVSLTIFGMFLTPIVFEMLYAGKYNDAVSISYMLWIMRAINCGLRMVPINMLPAIGRTKFNAIMSICSCVVQTLLDYVMIKQYGINGVAVGAIVVYFFSAIVHWCYFFYVCRSKTTEQQIT